MGKPNLTLANPLSAVWSPMLLSAYTYKSINAGDIFAFLTDIFLFFQKCLTLTSVKITHPMLKYFWHNEKSKLFFN